MPCFLWIFVGAPFVERLRGNRALSAALTAITAAVVGVILNLAIWFGVHTLFREVRPLTAGPLDFELPVLSSPDLAALALFLTAAVTLLRYKVSVPWVLGGCALAGLAYETFVP